MSLLAAAALTAGVALLAWKLRQLFTLAPRVVLHCRFEAIPYHEMALHHQKDVGDWGHSFGAEAAREGRQNSRFQGDIDGLALEVFCSVVRREGCAHSVVD